MSLRFRNNMLLVSAIAGLFLGITSTVSAQSLQSVDVEAANMQIEQFENENARLTSDISLLEDSLVRLENEIDEWTKWKSGIERMADLLTQRVDDLTDSLGQIGSQSVAQRAQATLQRYDRIVALLDDKHQELEDRIRTAENLVSSHRSTIDHYRVRVEQNKQNISLLRTAIERSTTADISVESKLDGVDDLLDDAAKFLLSPEERSSTNGSTE